ncbi:MAG: fluoride efflux transporter CrcB [Kovacikia sp.]
MRERRRILNWFSQGGLALRSFLQSCRSLVRLPLAISLGAIAGALSRYYLTLGCSQWLGTTFPFGTFVINLSGALIMGFFVTLAVERTIISPDLRLVIAVGFLGSYTTFSSYQLDTEKLLMTGSWQITLLYWSGSASLGVLCLELGTYLARRLP